MTHISNQTANRYLPDYLVTPGEVLEDYLKGLGMTQAELAGRTGLAKKTINEIIKGKSPISAETALKFERALGRPAHFWNNLERGYQEEKTRLADQQRMESCLEWLDRVPVAAMARLGWIPREKDTAAQLEAVLRFFGVASPDQWRVVWQGYQAAYRQTRRFEPREESVSAWLRQGELQARQTECGPFDPKGFRNVLMEIRGLTREEPTAFVPRLKALCALAGVAVVFVPDLPKSGVSGATRWLGEKAVIQVSLRYKSNDHLWFTFFHEAGHILLHGRKDVFIEDDGCDGEKEAEANAFARDKLIPPAAYEGFVEAGVMSPAAIRHFAEKAGIAPGIVLGRLQHEKRIPWNTPMNSLKVFYRWTGTAG
jgi:addiction module HigA family antidote